MKTAISIPDSVFQRAETFACGHGMSRSALFTAAVEEYLRRHGDKDVTARLNEVHAGMDSSLPSVLVRLQAASLPRDEW